MADQYSQDGEPLDIFGSDPFGRNYLYGLSGNGDGLGLQPPAQGLQLDPRPYDQMQATPRGFISGLFSDVLGGALNMPNLQMTGVPALDLLYANRKPLMNLLGVGDVQKTAERISYGEPLTSGAGGIGGTSSLLPETVGAALTVAPFVGEAASFGSRAGRAGARMVGERMAENVAMGRPNLPSMFAEPRSSLFAVEPQAMPQGGRDAEFAVNKINELASNSIKPMEKVRIYRGSFDNSPSYSVAENYPNDVYGGVFGSSELRSAQAHGNGTIHFTDIPKNKILTHYELNYKIPYEKTKNALLKARPDLKNNPELFDEVYDIVVGDAGQDLYHLDDSKIIDLFRISPSEAYNETQRLRGQVSKNLGYRAIEMTDEHGSGTYLVAPGAKFKQQPTNPVKVSPTFTDPFSDSIGSSIR
jgi:hypothetical protein